MKVELGRIIGLCLAVCLPPALSASCASSEEDPVFAAGGKNNDAGFDSSAGTGFNGSGGSGATGGFGGTFPGGSGGANPGGTGGVGGTDPGGTGGTAPGGTGGASGASGSSSGSSGTSGGICNAAFCPNTGSGTPCCIPGLDSCGMDNGMGCVKTD